MDDERKNHMKSSYSSYSKVCYSDLNNPGKMICKERNNNNGNKQVKEYLYDSKEQNVNDTKNNSFSHYITNLFRKPIDIKEVKSIEEDEIQHMIALQEQMINKMFNESPLVSLMFPTQNYTIFNENDYFENRRYKEEPKKRPEVYHSYKIYEV